jgi:outer membrane protein assembly factor BamB
MLILAHLLSVATLAPQLDGSEKLLTPGAALAWELEEDLLAPGLEDARALAQGPSHVVSFVLAYGTGATPTRILARAFERATGVLAWSFQGAFAVAPGGAGVESFKEVAPAADGSVAAVLGAVDGVFHVAAYDVATGAERFDATLGIGALAGLGYIDRIETSADGGYVAVFGRPQPTGAVPAVRVLSGSDGSLAWGLDAAALGKPAGFFSDVAASTTTLFFAVQDPFSPASRTLYAYDLAGGTELWQTPVASDVLARLTVNAAGTLLAGVPFNTQETLYGPEVTAAFPRVWEAATGIATTLAVYPGTGVGGLEFDGAGGILAVLLPSDPGGFGCPDVTIERRDASTGALAWSAPIVPAFGFCEVEAVRLALTPGAAVVAVQSDSFAPADRVELHALELGSGALAWSETLGADGAQGAEPLAELVADGASITVTQRVMTSPIDPLSTQTSALAPSGTELWTRTDTESTAAYDHVIELALAADGAKLFSLEEINGDGRAVRALDADTGATLWSVPLDVTPFGTYFGREPAGLAVAPDGSAVFAHVYTYVGGTTPDPIGVLFGLDAQTGTELWRTELADMWARHRTLAIDATGEHLFAVGGIGVVTVQKVRASDGGIEWTVDVPFPSGGTVHDGAHDVELSDAAGRLYVYASFFEDGAGTDDFDAFVVSVDAANGAVDWTRHLDEGLEFVESNEGALSVDPTGTRVVIAFEDDVTHAMPDVSRVVALDAATGATVWSQALPAGGALEHVRQVGYALGGARAVAAGSRILSSADFRVVAVGFDAAGAKVWETSVATPGPVQVERVVASADGTAVAVVAGFPLNVAFYPTYDHEGYTVLMFDAVDGAILWSSVTTLPTEPHDVRTRVPGVALDASGLYVGGYHVDYPAGGTSNRYLARYALPKLTTPTSELSVTQGGAIPMAVRPGADKAGHLYLVLGSITGTQPGIPIAPGVVLPLAFDAWTNLTLSLAGKPGILPGSIGVLDAYGRATAAYLGQGSGATSLVGTTLYHAYATMHPATGVIGPASNPVGTTFTF